MRLVLILAVLLAAGGGVFFAARGGLVRIPGITPAKRSAAAQALYGEPKEAQPAAAKPAPSPKTPKLSGSPPKPKSSEVPLPDMARGRKKLAKLWDQVEAPKLAVILADWRDDEAAAVLSLMEPAKVAEVLTELSPKRASKLSREIQKAAAMPAPAGAKP